VEVALRVEMKQDGIRHNAIVDSRSGRITFGLRHTETQTHAVPARSSQQNSVREQIECDLLSGAHEFAVKAMAVFAITNEIDQTGTISNS
jgi:hypothetical protein